MEGGEGEYYEVIVPGTEGQKPSFPNTVYVHSASNSVPPALFPFLWFLPALKGLVSLFLLIVLE